MKVLPRDFRVLAWGCNHTLYGPVYVGELTLKCLKANNRALGYQFVRIDCEHCTVPGSTANKAGRSWMVFGIGWPEVLRGKGLYLTNVDWTPLGEEHARNFEDLSPAVAPKEPRSEVLFLHSVALTAHGAGLDLHAPWYSPKLHGLELTARAYEQVWKEGYRG